MGNVFTPNLDISLSGEPEVDHFKLIYLTFVKENALVILVVKAYGQSNRVLMYLLILISDVTVFLCFCFCFGCWKCTATSHHTQNFLKNYLIIPPRVQNLETFHVWLEKRLVEQVNPILIDSVCFYYNDVKFHMLKLFGCTYTPP